MWDYNHTPNADELCHYGILGMKWGIRRYQKSNGSLTSAGKKRAKQKGWSEEAKEVDKIKKKSVNEMSNAELKKANERMNLEQNYSRLNPSAIKKGLAVAGVVLATTNTAVNLYNNSGKIVDIGKSAVSRMMVDTNPVVRKLMK